MVKWYVFYCLILVPIVTRNSKIAIIPKTDVTGKNITIGNGINNSVV